jgi:CheY-like chemotaxis protein
MKAKILIVSKDGEIIKTATSILESEGHKIRSVNSHESCLAQCKAEPYDLVIIDAHTSAVKFAAAITDLKKTYPDTEIVVITGYTSPEAMMKAEMQSINNFVILPLTADKLKTMVNRVLRQNELLRENRRLLLAVTAAKKEWEATVDAIEDPILVTDFDYNILRANLTTFQLLGKGVNEVIGHKCYEVLHCSDNPDQDCPGKRARDSGEPVSETLAFKGFKKRLTCSVYPQVFAAGGGLVHYFHEPVGTPMSEAELLTKYERLFLEAAVPILLVGAVDFKVVEANQRALELLDQDPESIMDKDLENLFAPSERELAISSIIKQMQGEKAGIATKVLSKKNKEVDVNVIAEVVEIGEMKFAEIVMILKNRL